MENFKEMRLGFILYFHLPSLSNIMVTFAQINEARKEKGS